MLTIYKTNQKTYDTEFLQPDGVNHSYFYMIDLWSVICPKESIKSLREILKRMFF